MVKSQGATRSVRRGLAMKLMAGAAILVLAAGCTRTSKKDSMQKRLASFDYSKRAQRPALKPNHPLHIAATKWARVHQKKPADPIAAVNYARTLKALGSKDKAMEVLARTYQINPGNGKLASEYGRLALDMGRVQLAEQLLSRAQRAKGQTDWKVLSALGTLNAKRSEHKKAQTYYLAALRQKPDATSVFNNLALSYALDGRVGDAENLLKRAVAKGHNTRKVRQNLALVLGLQSKFGEAQQMAQTDLNGDKVDNNVSFMRDMVKPTKVANAKSTKSKTKGKAPAKADPVTTAALPKKQKIAATVKTPASVPLPLRKPVAPVKMAATTPVQTKSVRKTPKPARQVPVNTSPASRVTVAATPKSAPVKTKAKAKAVKRAPILPWNKKPAATRKTVQTAKLSNNPASVPTNILPHTSTNWSMAVTHNVSPTSGATGVAARKKTEPFEFPTAN